jgi:uncharacterized protein YegJ (DUF2314 family)
MPRANLASFGCALTLIPLVLLGCNPPGEQADRDESGVVKREGQPDYIRTDEDPVVERAVAKARETYEQFITASEAGNPNYQGFAIKKGFATPEGGLEHIWVTFKGWDGEKFRGVIDNEPVDTQEVRLGDQVTVTPEELSDWMYLDGRTLVGGYTVRALHYSQPIEAQKAFEEQTGMVVPPVDF